MEYQLRNFHNFSEAIVLGDDLDVRRREAVDPQSRLPGFFVEDQGFCGLLAKRNEPLLFIDRQIIAIDAGMTLTLENGPDGRHLLVARNDVVIGRFPAPEPTDFIDDPYDMDDFFVWLVGRFESAERKHAFMTLSEAG